MKDDILRFRKVCNILKDKGWKLPQIVKETGVSEPTYYKLINTEISELKIQASVLGLVQDFIKKHVDDVNYSGIETTLSVSSADISPQVGRKSARAQKKKIASPDAKGRDRNDETKERKPGLEPKVTDDFIKFMRKLTAECPSNLKIKITING